MCVMQVWNPSRYKNKKDPYKVPRWNNERSLDLANELVNSKTTSTPKNILLCNLKPVCKRIFICFYFSTAKLRIKMTKQLHSFVFGRHLVMYDLWCNVRGYNLNRGFLLHGFHYNQRAGMWKGQYHKQNWISFGVQPN